MHVLEPSKSECIVCGCHWMPRWPYDLFTIFHPAQSNPQNYCRKLNLNYTLWVMWWCDEWNPHPQRLMSASAVSHYILYIQPMHLLIHLHHCILSSFSSCCSILCACVCCKWSKCSVFWIRNSKSRSTHESTITRMKLCQFNFLFYNTSSASGVPI